MNKLGVNLLILTIALLNQTYAFDNGILSVKPATAVDENDNFCIGYDSTNTTLPKQTLFRPLLDLSSSVFCKEPTNTEDLEGKVILVKNGNCSLLQKALIAEKYAADSIVVIVDGIKRTNFSGTEELTIAVAIIHEDDVKQIQDIGDNLVAGLSAPDQPSLDYNMAVIWIMATGTAVIGALWGGSSTHKSATKKKRKNSTRRAGTEGNDSTDQDDDDNDSNDSMPITPVVVIVWVCMIVIILLLMFYLYDYFVYIIIGLYSLGAIHGLYVCLSPLILFFFPFKARIPELPFACCTGKNKRPPLVVSMVLLSVCITFVVLWLYYRHADFAWIMLDIMGIAFCISILKTIRINSFKTCFLLLSLLFFYDVFMVFITPYLTKTGESIMVEVATGSGGTKEQIPVLLQVPRLCTSVYSVCYGTAYSMLGFGDILIPGLLISHCYAFDLKVKSKAIYLFGTSIAYGVGLLLTFLALAIMQMGQPALLYLVPTTVGTALTIAKYRGEVRHLWTGSLENKNDGENDSTAIPNGLEDQRAEEGQHVSCQKRRSGSNESLQPLMDPEVIN